jgi:quercetin dioxygenase-like cupin family protein
VRTHRPFDGHEHGARVSFFLSHNKPGTGPALHRHPYEETFIVEEGEVIFTVGESTIEARAGDIVVVPAGAPGVVCATPLGNTRLTCTRATVS